MFRYIHRDCNTDLTSKKNKILYYIQNFRLTPIININVVKTKTSYLNYLLEV